MKKLGMLLLGLASLPLAHAQEPAADAAAPAADTAAPADSSAAPADAGAPAADTATAPADASAAPAADTPADASAAAPPADAAPASDAAPADATAAAPAESAPADSGSTDASATTETAAASDSGASAPSEGASESEHKPWKLYAGYDYAHVNLQITQPDAPNPSAMQTKFGGDFFTGEFHQVRAGVRIFDVIGLEAHYGVKASKDDKPEKIGVKNVGGLYFVPTGTILETVEFAALIGYSYMQVERPGVEATLRGVSYGVNLELPIRLFSESLPDFRLGGGAMVYQRNSESRTYGAHFGLRYDFQI